MTDFAKQLRKRKLRVMSDAYEAIYEAADRIEALEAALRDVVDRLVDAFPATEDYPPIKKARAALAGEKKDASL